MSSSKEIKGYFEKGEFLYNIYREENVGTAQGKLDAEVTGYAVQSYLKYYSQYDIDNWKIGNCENELKHRRQMSTWGCYLMKYNTDEICIDIAGDILTSPKKRINTILKTGSIGNEDFEILCKQSKPYEVRKKLRKIALENTSDEVIKSMAAFVIVSHTIGNMIPVPEGLNMAWSDKEDWIKPKIEYLKDLNSYPVPNNNSSTLDLIKRGCNSKLTYKDRREAIFEAWARQMNTDEKKDILRMLYLEENRVKKLGSIRKGTESKEQWLDKMTELIICRGYRIMNKKEISDDKLKEINKYLKNDSE